MPVDIFDSDVTAFLLDKAIEGLLDQVGLYWRYLKDRLQGLQGDAWFSTYQAIKKQIENEVSTRLVGEVITLTGKLGDNVLIVRKIGDQRSSKITTTNDKFVERKTNRTK